MSSFYYKILNWYDQNQRDLPWRNINDAYKIWLSEIILQQTRVDQGLRYYLKFIKEFPTIQDLAASNEDKVLKLWEGLGYYSRGRNLLVTAKQIVDEYDSKFPCSASELRNLKGIGPYTSAAISSIANNEKIAAVDGNAFRVLSRYYDIDLDISKGTTRKYFEELMTKLIEGDRPGDFNQAVMDLGASICSPKKYECLTCPLSGSCLSLEKDLIDQRPVKTKKLKIRDRYLNFLVIQNQNMIATERRATGIWKGLYQLPLIETSEQISGELQLIDSSNYSIQSAEIIKVENKAHKLSHQNLFITYWKVESNDLKLNSSLDNLQDLSFPKPLREFIEKEILEIDI